MAVDALHHCAMGRVRDGVDHVCVCVCDRICIDCVSGILQGEGLERLGEEKEEVEVEEEEEEEELTVENGWVEICARDGEEEDEKGVLCEIREQSLLIFFTKGKKNWKIMTNLSTMQQEGGGVGPAGKEEREGGGRRRGRDGGGGGEEGGEVEAGEVLRVRCRSISCSARETEVSVGGGLRNGCMCV